MVVKLLTERHLDFLNLKGGCIGLSESTHVKMPHCWKSHVAAHIQVIYIQVIYIQVIYIQVIYIPLYLCFWQLLRNVLVSQEFYLFCHQSYRTAEVVPPLQLSSWQTLRIWPWTEPWLPPCKVPWPFVHTPACFDSPSTKIWRRKKNNTMLTLILPLL